MQDTINTISRRLMLATGIVIVVILLTATAVFLAVQRRDALEGAEARLASLATALGEQTRNSVRAVELLARTTADELRGEYLAERLTLDRRIHDAIRARMATLPNVRAVLVTDHRGNAALHSSVFPAPAVNYGDREYIRAHLERRIQGLHVGEPVYGRVVPEWLTVFSYRVEDGRGEFQGVVSAAVPVQYFQDSFAALKLGAGTRVFLFRADGVLLAAYPADISVPGKSFAQDPLFQQAPVTRAANVQHRAGFLDDQPRIIALERLRDFPILVAVSVTEAGVLAPWRREAWRDGASALAAAGVLSLALWLILRQQRSSVGLEHDLRETSQRMNAIIQSAMDAIITLDADQNIVMFNAAAERVFRCTAAEAIGGSLDRFLPERFRVAHRRHVEHFGGTGTSTRRMGGRIALSGLRADGEEFPIDASISQVEAGGRKYFTVILRDITERKAAEAALERSHEELRELSAAMHEVREAERLRIARELHDELAQWLTALKMDVAWLSSRLPRNPPHLVDRAEKIKGVVDTTVAAVRRIAADLRPMMLDDLGLVPAVEHLLHDLSQRAGIVVSLDADSGKVDFGEPLASGLYRIAQEALTNVVKHAAATEVQVAIKVEDEELVLTVCDNGRGYDAAIAARRKSYGLLGMRERAHTLGGTARIERLAQGGTVVEIVIPVARYHRRET